MLEAAKSEVSKSETAKSDVVKTETVKEETNKSETNEPDVPIPDNTKTEILDPKIKLESTETQETQEDKVEINDSISSAKTESTSTETLIADKNLDDEQNIVEKEETLSNDKPEPMEVENEENKIPPILDDKEKQEETTVIQTEEPDDKLPEIVDQQDDDQKPETVSEENKPTDDDTPDTQEKDKEESPTDEVEKTGTIEVQTVQEPINTEVKDATNEISSDTSSKPDTKVIEKTTKSNEFSTPLESVDRLKAMFPELEVLHKDVSTPTTDKLPMHKPLQQIDQTIAHLLATSYQNPIKWPKVKTLKKKTL